MGTHSTDNVALRVKDITLDIKDGTGTRRLLDHINFTVAPGELVGITGPSGSGKSTLLAIVGCLTQPSSGEALLSTNDGEIALHEASGAAAAAIRRDHLGIVFQQANLLPALTVEEQLLLMPRLGKVFPIKGKKWQHYKDKAARLLAGVELEDLKDRKVSDLSGGQQARVNLARALMNDPQMLLIDEPTAALDTHAAEKVTELIRTMAKEANIPALYVSHDEDQLATLDRTLTLVDGKLED
ncbi:MAG TPA: ABC transporter ATP-binding protein [Candidatus Corynebacterium gallistercoris]|uniref:ABC transporter ATP-binding protein n=1 Tax=Candidatus Corynebacterium gallistercoris TaxID=2838530 RepID=A0A9D1S0W7_9CORY|nr:ABC transporter ATP-binding protein [Candidatus Corynebacterium gallistercoris]